MIGKLPYNGLETEDHYDALKRSNNMCNTDCIGAVLCNTLNSLWTVLLHLLKPTGHAMHQQFDLLKPTVT